jgi:hypothetical protein
VNHQDTKAPREPIPEETYLELSGYRLGLLVNFNSVLIKQGIQRIAL